MTIQGYNNQSGGIVGINTENSQYTLHVNGTGKFNGNLVTNDVYVTNKLRLNSTDDTNYKLDCHGNASIAGSLNFYSLIASDSIWSPNGLQVYKYVKLTNNTNGVIQIGNSATYAASGGTTTFNLPFPLK